jgi:hypothetical protein
MANTRLKTSSALDHIRAVDQASGTVAKWPAWKRELTILPSREQKTGLMPDHVEEGIACKDKKERT